MIIVNADDYGYSHEINAAVRDGFASGVLDRASILMNAPFVNEAIKMAFENGYADKIGIHLNLTLGVPMSKEALNSILSVGGVFTNLFKKNKCRKLFVNKSTKKIISIEIEKQIKAYLEAGFSLKHLDSHHHIHTNMSIINLIIQLAEKYGLKSIRVARYYPGISLGFLSRIYKRLINVKINKFNQNKKVWMLEVSELDKIDISAFCNKGIIEIECHPIYSKDDKLIENSIGRTHWYLRTHPRVKYESRII